MTVVPSTVAVPSSRHPDVDPLFIGVNALKALSVLVTFLVALLASCAPLYLATKKGKYISWGNTFSAGVFLSMGLLHLLPEAGESFAKHWDPLWCQKYRPEFVLCIIGYTIVMTVQRVVFPTPTCPSQVHSMEQCHVSHSHGGDVSESATVDAASLQPPSHTSYGSTDTTGNPTDVTGMNVENCERNASGELLSASPPCPLPCCAPENGHHHGNRCPAGDDPKMCGQDSHLLLRNAERLPPAAMTRSYVLMLALSLHSMTEGLALGLQDSRRDVLMLMVAIASHKWAESFALGSSFLATNAPRYLAVRFAVLFSLSTPLGIVIGWAAHALLPSSASAVFKALSAGTFLYIGASEVVVEEFVQGKQYWVKWVFFLMGLAVMYWATVTMG